MCILAILGYVTCLELYTNIVIMLSLAVGLLLTSSIRPLITPLLVLMFQIPPEHSPARSVVSASGSDYYFRLHNAIPTGIVFLTVIVAIIVVFVRLHRRSKIRVGSLPLIAPSLLLSAAFLLGGVFSGAYRIENLGLAFAEILGFFLIFYIFYLGLRGERGKELLNYFVYVNSLIAILLVLETVWIYYTGEVIATGVDEEMQKKIREDVQNILLPMLIETLAPETAALFKGDHILHVNPTGKFVIGGPHGDTGLTGRKIIVDTYGGKGAHGGGAFSGKDPSKVDRSAAYASRYIAKNMVAAGVAREMLVQVSYAIGVARPLSIFVNTYGTAANGLSDAYIAEKINELFDLRPAKIIEKFGLKKPIYEPTASYGHVGRDPYKATVSIRRDGKYVQELVQFFGWELLDSVDMIKKAFNL